MATESSRPIWPFVLTGLVAIGVYLYYTTEYAPDAMRAKRSGSAEDIEALADRDDTNVLFILIDTLRSERMSAYGYERETTPFMARLAESGIRFDRNIAQSSWTKTSMASLWSSLNPIRSGVTKFADTVSSEIQMPAEILADAGFKTVGLFRNGWVNGYFGFDQGFEKYYRPMGGVRDPAEARLRPNADSRGTDESVIDDAIEFLRIHGHSDRWFLYLHLMDLHEYTYDDKSAVFGNAVPDIYDNSLLRTDWMISRLLDYMADRDLLEKTIVVLVSDHGEAFGERGFEGHARNVLPETTETPWILSLPFRLQPGVVVRPRSANVDVWPTLLELLGLPDQGEIDGRSRLPEILAAVREAEASGTDRADPEGLDGDLASGDVSVAFLDENWGQPGTERKPAVSVVVGPYRYVSGSDVSGRPFELLLSVIDGQRMNLLALEPEVAEQLRVLAQESLDAQQAFQSDDIELDQMQLDQLRALGYQLP